MLLRRYHKIENNKLNRINFHNNHFVPRMILNEILCQIFFSLEMLCFSLILDEWTLLGHCRSLLLVAVIFNLCSVENFQKLCSLGSHSETSQFIETLLRDSVMSLDPNTALPACSSLQCCRVFTPSHTMLMMEVMTVLSSSRCCHGVIMLVHAVAAV